jgi:GTP-binding protein HflX
MNAIARSDALVADQLFATLDPTTRRITLPNGRHATVSDTVGFVGKLPHDLVEAFRSTLEEVALASLVVHVADASSPELATQIDAVREVLGEIGAGAIPEVLALNKIDLVQPAERAALGRRFAGAVEISAITGEGIGDLEQRAADTLPRPPVEVTLLVPYGREEVTARLYREAEVLSSDAEQEGTLVRARVDDRLLAAVRDLEIDGRGASGDGAPRPDGRRRPAPS